ncbi:MAG: YMGG-like glycine zipper-containing protein [Bauldia sp.]
MKRITSIAAAGLLAASLAGCASDRVSNSTLTGAGIGAAIGGLSTGRLGGAAVGGAVGAGAGYLWGNHSYRCQKRNLFGQVYWGWCLH